MDIDESNRKNHMIKFKENTDKLKVFENLINMEDLQDEVIIEVIVIPK